MYLHMRWEKELLYYNITFFVEFIENGFSDSSLS